MLWPGPSGGFNSFMFDTAQVKDATLKKVKTLEEQKETVETERDTLKVRCHHGRLNPCIDSNECSLGMLSEIQCRRSHQCGKLMLAVSLAAAAHASTNTALRSSCCLDLALNV